MKEDTKAGLLGAGILCVVLWVASLLLCSGEQETRLKEALDRFRDETRLREAAWDRIGDLIEERHPPARYLLEAQMQVKRTLQFLKEARAEAAAMRAESPPGSVAATLPDRAYRLGIESGEKLVDHYRQMHGLPPVETPEKLRELEDLLLKVRSFRRTSTPYKPA